MKKFLNYFYEENKELIKPLIISILCSIGIYIIMTYNFNHRINKHSSIEIEVSNKHRIAVFGRETEFFVQDKNLIEYQVLEEDYNKIKINKQYITPISYNLINCFWFWVNSIIFICCVLIDILILSCLIACIGGDISYYKKYVIKNGK